MPYKVCNKCQTKCGVRSLSCTKCNEAFIKKMVYQSPLAKAKKKSIPINWRTLRNGDKIAVLGASGPYYLGKDNDRTYLTDKGMYLVDSICNNGIHAHGESNGNAGYHFLYMGEEIKSPLCFNLWRSPTKIVLIKQ